MARTTVKTVTVTESSTAETEDEFREIIGATTIRQVEAILEMCDVCDSEEALTEALVNFQETYEKWEEGEVVLNPKVFE